MVFIWRQNIVMEAGVLKIGKTAVLQNQFMWANGVDFQGWYNPLEQSWEKCASSFLTIKKLPTTTKKALQFR